MVAATQQQQQPPAAAAAPSAEEEALKRNTDCVYFLASPLTCKKGSECEYRHSEYARVNPRDCYFWLNGNCLNPKCGFRHPPLDGLFGAQAAVGTGSVLPPSHTVVTPAAQTPYNSSKQPVPCIFFQKGLCIKGDRCAFLHGPNPTSNKVPQPTASPVSTDPPPQKKSFGGLQKCTQEQKISPAYFSKVVEATSESKSVQKAEIAPPRNGVGVERIAAVPKSMDDEIPRHRPTILSPVVDENSSRSTQLHQSQVIDDLGFQIGKETDDLLRESSPGFDVLVDDELRDSNYYHGEDHYDRTGAHDGRNLNSMDSYNMLRSTDYSSVADIDQDKYRDPQSFDSYERMQGYAWEQHRISSERMLGGSAHLERRGYSKADSPGHVDESDLRYRLSKQRRVNGLRSVVSHDLVLDNYIEERSFRGPSRSHQLPLHEGSISNRLRGRIKLPERSSNCGSDINGERGMERGRNQDRLSPGRSQIPHQGRLRDRIKGRVEEDYKDEGRNVRGPRMRREIIDDRNNDFAGPKSLAELKVTKNSEDKIHLSLGKRKHVENQQSEVNLSFEGPLPLREILKRKKEAEGAAYGSVTVSANRDVNNQREIKESFVHSSNNPAVADKQIVPSSFSSQILKDMGESEFTLTDAEGTAVEGIEFAGDQSSNQMNTSEPGTEDGMIDDDGVEYHEYEGDDQRDGDYEYEQVDDGDYNYEEGENAEGEEEYVDDEDGEDFAKKIGVMFS